MKETVYHSFRQSVVQNTLHCASSLTYQELYNTDLSKLKVFDFGWTIDNLLTADKPSIDAARREGHAEMCKGTFHLPFPRCIFCWQEKPDFVPNANYCEVTISYVVILTQVETSSFEFLLAVSTGGKKMDNTWALVGAVARVISGPHAPRVTLLHPSDVVDFNLKWADLFAPISGSIISAATMLARPGSVVATKPPASRGQRLSRRNPQHQNLHHVIHLSRDQPRPQTTTTNEMPIPVRAHDRRAHQRQLCDGRIIAVKSCRIHGGNLAATAVYKVVE